MAGVAGMWDVIIVGAGPAGTSTALFLVHARPDLRERIVIVDKAYFPRDKYCAGAVGQRADDRLQAIGVRIDVPSVKVHGMSVALRRGVACRRIGDLGRVIRRVEFDHGLVKAVRARGIRVIEGTKVESIERRTDDVILRGNGAVMHARAIVGADGVGSVVRRHVGLSFGSLRARVVEVDTEPVSGDPASDLLHFDARDASYTGYGWDFPTLIGGERMMCRGVYALGVAGAKPAAPESILARRLEASGLDLRRYHRKPFVERGFELHRPYAADRVMLVGEAAGIDPFLGEGIAQAVEYGELAAAYLAEKLARGDFAFSDWTSRVRRSKLGIDLAVRVAFAPFAYGPERDYFDEYLVRAPEALDITTSLFAGRSVPLGSVARAGIHGGLHAARRLARALLHAGARTSS